MRSWPKVVPDSARAASATSSRRGTRIEDVDAHAARAAPRRARHGLGLSRLLLEADHAEVAIDLHHAELPRGLLERDLDAAHGHVGAALDVLGSMRA
jgi:hypothetical protein